jgi:hypothetical protein
MSAILNNPRNTLTIAEVCTMMTAEHAAKLLASEFWWTIVPSTEGSGSFAETGSSAQFWALVTQIRELGQPLGFHKVENHLGNLTWKQHNSPELALAAMIKPSVKAPKPDLELIKIRAAVTGEDADAIYKERMTEYTAEIAVAQEKNRRAIAKILSQEPAPGEDMLETSVQLGEFNEETGEYEEFEVVYGEHLIPIDRAIKHIEGQIQFLAKNKKIPDEVFVAENTLYSAELSTLKAIVQVIENEGEAPDYVAAMDNRLLDAAGMQAGGNSGK